MHEAGRNSGESDLILFLAAAASFQPVTAVAEVTTSNGKSYRVETCFTDPKHLRTRFVYPDRSATFVIDGDSATTAEGDDSPQPASESEKGFAFGHNFHAIHFNSGAVLGADRGLPYGGQATALAKHGRTEGYRFDLPGTTPIELKFSNWRGKDRIPYRLELTHAGVTYDYRYTKVEFIPC